MLKKFLLFITIALLTLPLGLKADVSGKVAGTVTDKKTGDPLELANVVLIGTQYGASSDRNGRYSILNVPAGIYDIKFAYLGYKPVVVKGIRVVPDITITVDMALQELDLEVDEIVVQASRPLFERGSTSSVRVVEKDQLANLPTRGIQNVAALSAGIVKTDNSGGETRNATLNIRGGRGNETAYIIDGVMVNDNASGGAAGQISQGAIDQISIQIGSFDAKYGQVMSGIINTVTRTGSDNYSVGGEVVTSEFTDNFGYNLYSMNVGGPVFGVPRMYFYGAYERTYVKDSNPRWSTDEARANMEGGVHKYSGKINYNISTNFRSVSTFHGSYRRDRNYVHLYSKNNSEHNPRVVENQWLANQRFSYTLDEKSFINFDVHYRYQEAKRGDGVWFDNIEAYGDTTMALINPRFTTKVHPAQGGNYGTDSVLIFSERGVISDAFVLSSDDYIGSSISFTTQQNNHLIEAGANFQLHTFRTYGLSPLRFSIDKDVMSSTDRFYREFGRAYGYDEYGNRSDKGDQKSTFNPLYPIIASAYLQDRIELKDLIFSVGMRVDYFNPDGEQVKNPNLPLGPENVLDDSDFEKQETFIHFSPRLGIAFPVTENMKFHAAYGQFIAPPTFFDVYGFRSRIRLLESDASLTANTGNVKPENTISYEAGVSYAFSNIAAVEATVFYKEVKDLVNTNIFSSPKGLYYSASNLDFSTVKGFMISTSTRRIADYIQFSGNYTYQMAEGTGSASNSNTTAAFRSGVILRQIRPLDFDQRHTISGSFDIRSKAEDGPQIAGFYPFGKLGANLVLTYASGRPYTPRDISDVYNTGSLVTSKGPVNSAQGPSSIRLDAKFDKSVRVDIGNTKMNLVFYVWIINLLDTPNAINLYSATGSPVDSGYLNSQQGQSNVEKTPFPDLYEADYKRFERDPENYGAAQQIRLGLRFDL